jgi:8-oxo-dGTP pyrophosphatase MutT (NUDIX family)
MQFDHVLKVIQSHLETGQLPDEKAHRLLAPYQRLTREEALAYNPNPKLSAVLILLYPDKRGVTHTVLMERNAYKGVHSKQISFPGGKCEPDDTSFEFTALRETEEEIGLLRSQIEIIGKLSDVYIPPSGFLVEPFVATCSQQPEFRPDHREVKSILESPIQLFTQKSAIKSKQIRLSNQSIKIEAPYFDVFGHTVWGATAMMLGELRYILNQEHEQ